MAAVYTFEAENDVVATSCKAGMCDLLLPSKLVFSFVARRSGGGERWLVCVNG